LSDKPHDKHEEHGQTGHRAEPTERYKIDWPPVYAVRIEPIPGDTQKFGSEQLYKKKQLRLAKCLNWITALTVVVTAAAAAVALVGLHYLNRQLFLMRASNDISSAALDASNRPWVGVSEIVVGDGLNYNEGRTNAKFKLGFVLKNVGHSPAFYKIYGEVIDAGTKLRPEQRYICNKGIDDVKKSGDQWPTTPTPLVVVPELATTYYVPYTGEPGEEPPLVIKQPLSKDGFFQPYIIGCVVYRSVTDKTNNELHETGFYGEITHVGPDGTPPAPYPSKGIRLADGDIPMKKLCVINVLSFGSAN